MTSLSIILPTIGRPTLARTLASIVAAGLVEGDEVVCVGDGPCPAAHSHWGLADVPGRYLETPSRAGDWGHSPRNLGMRFARGDWLLSLDDDDVYLPGALADARAALAAGPRRPHLFRLYYRPAKGGILWADREVRVENVSTQLVAVPNDPPRLGVWGSRYEGDFDFLASTLAFYREGPVWREEILARWNAEA